MLTNQLIDLSRQSVTIIEPVDGVHDGLIVSFSIDGASANDVAEFQKASDSPISNDEIAAKMLVAFGVEWNLKRMIPAVGNLSAKFVDDQGREWKADADGKPIIEPVPVTVDAILSTLGYQTFGKIVAAMMDAINPKAMNGSNSDAT